MTTLPARPQAWLDGFLAGYHETLCDDPECTNPAHLPEPDDWSDVEELASWVEDDTRARRRADA